MNHEFSINTPEEYFDALRRMKYDEIPVADDPELKAIGKAIHRYLIGLSPTKREQIAVHAPSQALREHHKYAVSEASSGGSHALYLRVLAHISQPFMRVRPSPATAKELLTEAAVGVALSQKRVTEHKERIKSQGRVVQCQWCANCFHSQETERIKPYGSTTYQRFCRTCAEKVKMAKAIYKK